MLWSQKLYEDFEFRPIERQHVIFAHKTYTRRLRRPILTFNTRLEDNCIVHSRKYKIYFDICLIIFLIFIS